MIPIAIDLYDAALKAVRVDIASYIQDRNYQVLLDFLSNTPSTYIHLKNYEKDCNIKSLVENLITIYVEQLDTEELLSTPYDLFDLFDLLVITVFEYPLSEFAERREFMPAVYGGHVSYIFEDSSIYCSNCTTKMYRNYGTLPTRVLNLNELDDSDMPLSCDECSVDL